jgi:hypothetical protein
MDGTQRMSGVLSDNCGSGATREPVHCRNATLKSGFSTIQASSCTQHPLNALKVLVQLFVCHLTMWYKFMVDNAVPITKTQPTSP